MQLKKTDLFTFIHKAIRSMIYNSASKLQSADFSDKEESEIMISMLRDNLDMLHEHAIHEDNVIFPSLKDEEPEMVDELNEEHQIIEEKLKKIYSFLDEFSKTEDDNKRLEESVKLNLMFNDFAALYLTHMNNEEGTALHASMKHLSDEELIGIRTRIQQSVPPERYKVWLGWMLRSLNNTEISGMLGGMKAGAPPQIFQNVADAAEAVLDPGRWIKIKTALKV